MRHFFCVIVMLGLGLGESLFAEAPPVQIERPVRTHFRVVFKQILPASSEDYPRDKWAWVPFNGTKRLVHVDLNGVLVEYVLDSSLGRIPADLQVQNGDLYVRDGGRVFKHSPMGRIETRTYLAPVPHTFSGPYVYTVVNLPRLVSDRVYVETSQWVEIVGAQTTGPKVPEVPTTLPPPVPPAE